MSLPHMKIKCSGQLAERIEKQREKELFSVHIDFFESEKT